MSFRDGFGLKAVSLVGRGGVLPAADHAHADGEGERDQASSDRSGFEVEEAQGRDDAQHAFGGACRAEQAASGGGGQRGDCECGDRGRPQDASQASGAQQLRAVVGEDEGERDQESGQ